MQKITKVISNKLLDKDNATYPVQRYTQVQVLLKIRCHHTFGYPEYAVINSLKEFLRHPKGEVRERLGINLVPSPRHASSVYLILNLQRVLSSLQFHIKFDKYFSTVRPSSGIPSTFFLLQLISGLKVRKFKSVLTSEGECIYPDPFIPTR